MKTTKHLIHTIALLTIIGACNSNSNTSKTTSQNTNTSIDTIDLWVDSSIYTIANEERKSFENVYNFPRLNITSYNEDNIVKGLMDNSVSFAILHRKLNEKEIEYLRKKESFTPKQYEFAYDAYVFLSSDPNRKSISYTELQSYFNSDKQQFSLSIENHNAQAKSFIKTQFNLSNQQLSKLYAAKSLFDLIQKTKQSSNVIAVIPFSYISDVESDSIANLIKGLKVLSVTYADRNGVIRAISPSQETITTKEYPLISPLVLLNCNIKEKSGTNFVNFIFKQKAQRLILKCGLVPAIFPGREILINN